MGCRPRGGLGFSRAAPEGVSPASSGRFHPLSTPEEQVDLPEVPLLGTLAGLEPSADTGQSEKEKEIEARCLKVVNHHRAIEADLHEACEQAAQLQHAMWREKVAARREGRRPQPGPAQAWMAAHSRIKELTRDKGLFEAPNDGHDSSFQRPPWGLSTPSV